MQFFGIGPLELLLILVIMILVLGPKGMIQAARESGKFIRKLVSSPIWREIVGTSHEIRDLPKKIIKEAGIEAEIDELRRSTQGGFNKYPTKLHESEQNPDEKWITKELIETPPLIKLQTSKKGKVKPISSPNPKEEKEK